MVTNVFFYHPARPETTPGLLEDLLTWDDLELPHGSNLAEIPAGSLVVPRYRMIPFGAELEQEVKSLGSELINSYRQHRKVANLFSWAHLLEGLTAPAYTLDAVPRLPEGEYFVKGETNSKKASWFESAYAPNKRALLDVVRNLQQDQWIGTQEVVIRPFQKYRVIGQAVNGRPIFHERRAFYLDGQLLTEAHYWNVVEYGAPDPIHPEAYMAIQKQAVEAVGDLARFLVIDYAEYEDGSWGVVELNDGAMAGLSANSPETLWKNFIAQLS